MAVIDDMPGPATRRAVTAVPSALAPLTQVKSKLPLPALIYLLAVLIPIGFQLGPLAMTTLRLFLLVMIVPLMIRLLRGVYGKIFLTDILFIAHILWATLALAVNNPDQVVQQVGSVGMEFLGGYVMGRAYIRTPEAFAALCRTLVVLVLLTIPFAVHEALTGRPLIIEFLRKLPGMTSVAIVTIEGRMGLERVQASFAHPIHYGLFCSVAFSLAFVALKDQSSTARRYFTSVLIAGSGFLALSSGALLAIILQLFLIAWAGLFATVKQRWWLLIALFALAYVVIDIFSNRTPIRVFMSYATFSAHNAYWRSIIFEWGMKSVWIHPLFGIGLHDWVRPSFMHSGSMDNFWLVMAVRYGIPGFVPLVLGYIITTAKVMRRDFSADPTLTLFRRAWVFTFLGLSFTLTTVHVWTNIYSFVFFMFGAGVWLITAMPQTVDTTAAKTRANPAARPARNPARNPAGASRPDPLPDTSPSAALSAPRAAPPPRANTGPPPKANTGPSPKAANTGPQYTRFPAGPGKPQPPSAKDPSE